MVALICPVDRAAQVCAHSGKATIGIALAHKENAFVFQKSDRPIWKIVGLASLENLAGLEQDIRD